MVNLLTQHTQNAHAATPNMPVGQTSKLEKLPRPTLNLQMTESQWTFTKIQWDHDINQTEVPYAMKLTQLQAACSETLRQRVFHTELYSTLTTSEAFLKKMEELAVGQINPCFCCQADLYSRHVRKDSDLRV